MKEAASTSETSVTFYQTTGPWLLLNKRHEAACRLGLHLHERCDRLLSFGLNSEAVTNCSTHLPNRRAVASIARPYLELCTGHTPQQMSGNSATRK
jgi:hypothetical protein